MLSDYSVPKQSPLAFSMHSLCGLDDNSLPLTTRHASDELIADFSLLTALCTGARTTAKQKGTCAYRP